MEEKEIKVNLNPNQPSIYYNQELSLVKKDKYSGYTPEMKRKLGVQKELAWYVIYATEDIMADYRSNGYSEVVLAGPIDDYSEAYAVFTEEIYKKTSEENYTQGGVRTR